MRTFLSVLLVALVFLLAAPAARAELVYASTSGGQLISFDSDTPGTLLSNVAIGGGVGTTLVGIDFRPATAPPGILYGVSTLGGGSIYTIDRNTGATTLVYTLTTALSGTSFGVDFNPVPDALRIVSNTGQNLRIAGFPTGNFVTNNDSALSQTGVVAAAYSNNFRGTTMTTLYDIRSTDSSLYTQIPPNAGTLNLVGALGTTTDDRVSFDISGGTGTAFASLNGGNQFGTINLASGAFTNIGAIGSFAGQITGMSVTVVPEPGTMALLGMGSVGLAGFVWRRRRTAK